VIIDKRGCALSKIMIVDDDRTTVRLLQTLLELDGFEVLAAPRGQDVLELAGEANPDLFLMDYNLSDMNGGDVVRTLRSDPRFAETPVVMTSGMDVEQKALAAGATIFLVKPFEPDELPGLFNRLINA
jgi:CheY-like chemotaxis protein